jgi:hypothetical protein
MCANATKTAASLMTAIRPTLLSLLTVTGVASTPDGVAALAAFDAADKALAAWTPGTTSATVVQAIDAFTAVFNVLQIPEDAKVLESIISAGIVTVIGVVMANSPAPTAAEADRPLAGGGGVAAAHEETQAMHVAHVVADTTAKVGELVPGFKHSIWHSPSGQYKSEWNKAVKSADPKYATLKVA